MTSNSAFAVDLHPLAFSFTAVDGSFLASTIPHCARPVAPKNPLGPTLLFCMILCCMDMQLRLMGGVQARASVYFARRSTSS